MQDTSLQQLAVLSIATPQLICVSLHAILHQRRRILSPAVSCQSVTTTCLMTSFRGQPE